MLASGSFRSPAAHMLYSDKEIIGSAEYHMCELVPDLSVFLLDAGGWGHGRSFLREAMPWMRSSISWCAVARSCSWQSSCLFQENKPKNPVIEIPTVKWKEGGLLVARPSRGLPPRDQLSIGKKKKKKKERNARPSLLPTSLVMCSPVSSGLVTKLEQVLGAEGRGRQKNRHLPPC